MLIKLTHLDPNKEAWVETTKIVAMERNYAPKSLLIKRIDESEPELTIILLDNGKHVTCKETPAQIIAMM